MEYTVAVCFVLFVSSFIFLSFSYLCNCVFLFRSLFFLGFFFFFFFFLGGGGGFWDVDDRSRLFITQIQTSLWTAIPPTITVDYVVVLLCVIALKDSAGILMLMKEIFNCIFDSNSSSIFYVSFFRKIVRFKSKCAFILDIANSLSCVQQLLQRLF